MCFKLSAVVMVCSALALGQTVSIREFPVPAVNSDPQEIVSGPDGALWFTEYTGNRIGRITTAGNITEYTIPTASSGPYGIAAGSDGALWFTELNGNQIGRISTSGAFSEYPIPTSGSQPTNIALGPDGALWFTEQMGNNIGRITTAGVFTEYPVPTASSRPFGITAGPDGGLWFTELGAGQIGRLDPTGVFTEYTIPGGGPGGGVYQIYAITTGPDGALWFTSGPASEGSVGRVTTNGAFTNYSVPGLLAGAGPYRSIAAGPDGALWFTAIMGGYDGYFPGIGRITTAGVVNQYGVPTANSVPQGLASGPDGAIWFTQAIGEIGRITLIAATALEITTTMLPVATALLPYSAALTATGGTPPYTWAATSALPAGLALSSTGILSGGPLTPTPSQSLTVTVTDAASATASAAFSLTILPGPLQITTTLLPAGTIGVPYSQTLGVVKGTPPYIWGMQSGSLPPGLVLSGTGAITGTPTAPGLYTFTALVEDHYLDSGTQSLSILIQNGCTGAISSSGQTFGAAGGSGSVSVTTGAGCSWNVTAVPSWVTITSGASGSGAGTVAYAVAPNTSVNALNAILNIDGFPYTIREAASALSFIGSVPHLAAEGGWQTTFTLVNKNSTPAQAQVSLSDDAGDPLAVPLTFIQPLANSVMEATVEQTVAANASLVVQASGPATVPYVEGSAQIAATGATDGFAIFHFNPSNQEAVVPLETRNAPSYLLAFDNTDSVLTGVAIENVASSNATIPVVIRNDAGNAVTNGSVTLDAQGHTSFVLSTQFPQTANLRGTVELDTPSGGQISALGIRYTPPGTLTTIPVLANVGTTGGDMAHLAVNDGWQTTFALVNTGTGSVSATLSFFDDNGNPLPLPLTFPQGAISAETASTLSQTIAANSSLWVQSVGSASAALQTGSAQLTTTGNISGYAIFRYNPNGQEAVVPLETRNAGSYLIAFDNTNNTATGVAVSVVSTQAVSIPYIVRDVNGNQIGTGALALAANGHTSFLLSAMPAPAGIAGTVEFDTPAGAEISVLGIRSPPALTFTTLPALAK